MGILTQSDSNESELQAIAETVGKTLLKRRQKLVTAESCTGGLIAKLVTDVAGSSKWFDRGFITYSNTAKREMLGVPAKTLHRVGAVSGPTVLAMVRGALAHSAADWAIAVSGIAGPSGGTAEKPVGLVWIAWMNRGGRAQSAKARFPGGRIAVREATARLALKGLLERMRKTA